MCCSWTLTSSSAIFSFPISAANKDCYAPSLVPMLTQWDMHSGFPLICMTKNLNLPSKHAFWWKSSALRCKPDENTMKCLQCISLRVWGELPHILQQVWGTGDLHILVVCLSSWKTTPCIIEGKIFSDIWYHEYRNTICLQSAFLISGIAFRVLDVTAVFMFENIRSALH